MSQRFGVRLLGEQRFARLRLLVQRLRRSPVALNLASVGGATIAGRLLGLIVLGYAARVLGPERYGTVGFGLSVAAYASILLSPGLVTWGIREIARDRGRAGEILVTVRLMQVLLACVSYAAVAIYASRFVASHEERKVVMLCALGLFTAALSVDWVYNGLELMRIPALIGVVTTSIHVGALLIFVRSPEDIYNYALVAPGVGLIGVVIGYAVLLRRVRPAWAGVAAAKAAALASIPLGITMAMVVVVLYANNFGSSRCRVGDFRGQNSIGAPVYGVERSF
jgi:O-antigen/teichoic acid export membrane protein